jgi:2-polyprenyl-3-methyl-5-hydroxy-6-metoxy-1,4-benzoquinol methylase
MYKNNDILIISLLLNNDKIIFLNKLVLEQLNTKNYEKKIVFFLPNANIQILPISIISRIIDGFLYNSLEDVFESSSHIYIFEDEKELIFNNFNLSINSPKVHIISSQNIDFNQIFNFSAVKIVNKTMNKLKFLQLINFYPNYYNYFYKKYPQAPLLSYEEHKNLLLKDGFAATHYFALEMHKYGYDSDLIITNNKYLLSHLARKYNITTDNIYKLIAEIINVEKPDIVYSSDMLEHDKKLTQFLTYKPKLLIGWRSQVVDDKIDWSDYDIIVSNLLKMRDISIQKGAKYFELFYPGYPEFINNYLTKDIEQNIDISFAGQISLEHTNRIKYLEIIAHLNKNFNFNYKIFTPNNFSYSEFEINKYLNKELFGIDYYQNFLSSKINLNIHIDIADNIGNMRLFEITGAGGFLLTDYHPNLDNIFKIGKEIEAFETPEEMIEKIIFYLKNDEKRLEIAKAGQERCLKDHSLSNRAYDLHKIIQKYLKNENLNSISQDKNILSPITQRENIKLLEKIPKDKIINGYKGFNTNVEKFFRHIDYIELYECLDTGYQFFYPFDICGDDNFYQDLSKFDWYYMENKWEFDDAIANISEGMSVIEIGSGRGYFLKKLKDKSINAVGLELNTEAVEISNRNNLTVYNEDLEVFAQKYPNKYDFVCSFQVLEHIPNVKKFLDSAIKLLKKNGVLYISVPNNLSFIKENDNDWLNMPPHHMGKWTANSLKKLTHFFDLELVKINYEPLAEYHYNYFLSILNSKIDPNLGLANNFAYFFINKDIKFVGHTMSAIFKRK